MKLTFKKRYTRFVALLAVGIIAAIGAARAGGWRDDDDGRRDHDDQLAQWSPWAKKYARSCSPEAFRCALLEAFDRSHC